MLWGRKKLAAVAAVLMFAWASPFLLGQGTPPAGDFRAKLDDTLAKVAKHDFGGDMGTVAAISELVAATHGKPHQRKELAGRLAAVLRSNAPNGAKDLACRQLAIIGTAEQVPALAALLSDEKLSHIARFALERIPGPVADEALRQTMGKARGTLLVGVINSVGQRRDEKAVGELGRLLGDADPAVAAAAAAALGKIGPAAADTLVQALGSAPARVRPAVAHACALCAEALAAQGKRDEAAALYDRLRHAKVPKTVRIAATRGAVLARQAAGVPLLVEQLRESDAGMFALAVLLVRELPGPEATKAAAAELGKLAPEKQIPLLQALADRGDKAATPAVLRLAQSGDAKVKAAAILALARLTDASAVPALLDAAAGSDGEVAQAAMVALATLPGKEIDAAIVATGESADAKLRRAAIELIGHRRITAATPVLLKAAADADESICLAAVKALGDTAGLPDLPAMADLLIKAKGPKDLAALEAALAAVSARILDKDVCAEKLLGSFSQAGGQSKLALLRTLGRIGGGKALEAMRAAAKDAGEETRDTALRILSDWPDVAAAAHLAEIAKTSKDPKYKILTLRGCIRLIGQADLPAEKKLAMCKEIVVLAERDEEKKLVLGVLGGVPSGDALAAVVPFLDNPATKNEAAAAAVAIAEKVLESRRPEVAEAMQKVLKATDNPSWKRRAKELLEKAGLVNPFFVFDNGLGGVQDPPKVLKQLGYAGMGASGPKIGGLVTQYQGEGLRVFSTYVGCQIGAAPAYDPQLKQAIRELKGTGVILWLTVTGGKPVEDDEKAVAIIREIADLAGQSDLRIALYPHTGFYAATTADALRLIRKVDRKNVGVTINLCHELMTDQGNRLDATIQEAMPRLFLVSINGADPKEPGYGWDRLIQPLGRGNFDVYAFVKKLKAAGYTGPIGLQCYGVKGDAMENLKQSITAWKTYCARMAADNAGTK